MRSYSGSGSPLETYHRRSLVADVAHIKALVSRHEVGQVVVGLPIRLDGRAGPEAEQTQAFVEVLERDLPVPVVTWDERLTTKAAEQVLIGADVSRRKRKELILPYQGRAIEIGT